MAPRKVKVLQRKAPNIIRGKHGRRFHAPRAANGFTTDPPGFQTEKDPRGKGSDSWFDLPSPTGAPPYHLDLSSILSEEVINKIADKKRLVFHTVGDTGGVNTTTYQQQVATYMELDFNDNDPDGANPSFFYHLGDVVYYDGEVINYYWEFYEPYLHYPAPIFAIPGNHDGDVDPNDQFNTPADSLKGFMRNFCSQAAIHLPEADDAPRDAMTQPNAYWTLKTQLATIIGLYTNVPEGGLLGSSQIDWFKQELASAPAGRALILSLHHPIYSAYGHHPGSQYLKSIIEEATQAAGRIPDLILTGHVHDYQRFTGNINGKAVTTIVAGAGGYNQRLHRLDHRHFDPNGVPYKFHDGPETLEKFNDFQHGYLIIDVREDKILGSYIAVDDPVSGHRVPTRRPQPYDQFRIPI
ncbi:metallophosphoesterase [Candidatus Acetothermia bacterium]|nr:metallophosphoesterase [Candidatus Acetothermia bacterium]